MYLLGLVGSGRIFSLFNAFELDRVKEMDHGHLGVWQYSGGSIGECGRLNQQPSWSFGTLIYSVVILPTYLFSLCSRL